MIGIPIFLSTLATFLAGVTGFFALRSSSQSLASMNQEHLIPLDLLRQISDTYKSVIAFATNRMNAGEITADEGITLITSSRELAQQSWSKYKSLPHAAKESDLISKADTLKAEADAQVEQIVEVLKSLKESNGGMMANQLGMFDGTWNQIMAPLGSMLDSLVNFQLQQAQEDYNFSQIQSKRSFFLILFVFLLGAFIMEVQGFTQDLSHLFHEIRTSQDESLRSATHARDHVQDIINGSTELADVSKDLGKAVGGFHL